MKTFAIAADCASLALTHVGGHLSDVVFTLPDGRRVTPMHTAPWHDEADLPADLPPVLRVLRGDFLCAPFGASDVIAGDERAHGAPANGVWREVFRTDTVLDAVLDEAVMGAALTKHVEVRAGEAAVYQRHVFSGGEGRLSVGHHAMLKAHSELQLAFGPRIAAMTPDEPVEMPPAGQSLLLYPQEIEELTKARTAAGNTVDLTRYPGPPGYEDLWVVVADAGKPFGWTAATCAAEGWVWFGLKNPRVLPATTVWMSNGGRAYAPWNSRHHGVIGLEEVCSYLHLGHAASIADNPLSARGVPTAITLGGEVIISYIFGVAPAPAGFGAVASITPGGEGILITDADGRSTTAAMDLSFLS